MRVIITLMFAWRTESLAEQGSKRANNNGSSSLTSGQARQNEVTVHCYQAILKSVSRIKYQKLFLREKTVFRTMFANCEKNMSSIASWRENLTICICLDSYLRLCSGGAINLRHLDVDKDYITEFPSTKSNTVAKFYF